MPKDIAQDVCDVRFASVDGELFHVSEDEGTGEEYWFFGRNVLETRHDLADFMKEWADRGTGRYEEEA